MCPFSYVSCILYALYGFLVPPAYRDYYEPASVLCGREWSDIPLASAVFSRADHHFCQTYRLLPHDIKTPSFRSFPGCPGLSHALAHFFHTRASQFHLLNFPAETSWLQANHEETNEGIKEHFITHLIYT